MKRVTEVKGLEEAGNLSRFGKEFISVAGAPASRQAGKQKM
jgi:hypothetical protein